MGTFFSAKHAYNTGRRAVQPMSRAWYVHLMLALQPSPYQGTEI